MKAKVYLSISACVFFLTAIKAQTTIQGDITLDKITSFTHDQNSCSSSGTMQYIITIANSVLGDSLKIINTSFGTLIDTASNYTGQNPWIINFGNFNYGQSSDVFLNNSPGIAFCNQDQTKIIFIEADSIPVSADTLYNIDNSINGFVSNPCLYESVSGKLYLDNNSNCLFDGTDVPLQSVYVEGVSNYTSPSSYPNLQLFTNSASNGDYSMLVQQTFMTNYTFQIPTYYQFIFPSTFCSPTSFSFTSLPQTGVDFSLQCTSNLDVQCYAQSNGIVRPNIPFFMGPYVSNTGCDSATGQLKLILDPNVTYNAGLSSNPATTVNGDTLIWNYTNLTSLSNGAYWNSFVSRIHLTPTLAVNAGDTLCFRIMSDIPTNDVDVTNNDITICLPVVNSYDPNIKEVSPKGMGPQGNIPVTEDELTYTIHFQNTGNAAAINISVIDSLDSDIIPASLKILGASHTMSPEWLSPGVVTFNFYGINLADSTSDEAASHGSVRFSVKLNSGLLIGTKIKNKAEIYFDFNSAIVTNTALNTIASVTGINEIVSTTAFVNVHPNPFSNNTTFVIQTDNVNETYSFEMFDVLGKNIKSIQEIATKEFQVSRNDLQNGVYFYKIRSAESIISIGKLVVQ